MKSLSLIVLGLAIVVAKQAHASTPHSLTPTMGSNNIVLWCGATGGEEKEKFPYLAAIKSYRSKKGHSMQVATVYEKGHLILRQYVYRHERPNTVAYESYGNAFSLSLKDHHASTAWAEFKAVVRDGDGTKLIGNGSIPCYLHGKRS